MKKIIIYILTFLFTLSFGLLYAQEDMVEKPAYITYLSGSVEVDLTPDNNIGDFELAELDMEIYAGSIIRTGQDALCEITMPDESTIKISSGSVFQVEKVSISKKTGKTLQRFNLLFGKLKAKVQKLTTTDSEFEIVSGTSLAGVRGTVYGVFYDGLKSNVLVFEGSVNLESVTAAFQPVTLTSGQMSFVPKDGVPEPVMDIPEDVLQDWESEFKKFVEEPVKKVEEVKEEVKEEVAKKEVAEKGKSVLKEFLRLNAYVGTVTIGDQVYARWIFTPQLNFGKFGMGLYLPAIFTPDVGIFGFKDWQNHDEWDFRNLGDGFHDFIIKFYYLSWGVPGDPVYAKAGSIDNFFLGHGFIVDNYSNMIYFPEEITVGMQLNIDAGRAGFETMIADFSRLQLFGARLFARPVGTDFPLAFGVTGFYDRPKPDVISIPGTTDEKQLPHILIFGADADFPLLNLDVFSLKLYADAAKLAYIYQEVPTTPEMEVVEPGSFEFVKGLGIGIGLMGKIAKIVNYRFEYRYIFNYYEPGMIDSLWENRRLAYQQELQELIIAQNQPTYEDTTSSGFLLEGGVILFKKLELGLGYENYKRVVGTTKEPVQKGNLYVSVYEGLIPKVYGEFSYDRTDNLDNVFKKPFDENTVLEANVVYQLAPMIGLQFSYNRTFQYDDETGDYEPIDSFGITTVFTFF